MSQFYKISFDWRQRVSPARAAALSKYLCCGLEKLVAHKEGVPELDDRGDMSIDIAYDVVLAVDIIAFVALGIPFKVETAAPADNFRNLLTSINDIQSSIARLMSYTVDLQGPATGFGQQFNSKVHVHVPGLGLMLVDQVTVLVDICTDELQSNLDDGWRILAVCPQPNTRRPDYILGRTSTGAK